jgi:hypothetical protein
MPGLAFGCALARQMWPLNSGRTELRLEHASSALPALNMQFACMHEPFHDLWQHVLPAAVLGITGWQLGPSCSGRAATEPAPVVRGMRHPAYPRKPGRA